MAINVRCRCGRRIKVRDSAAGKRVRCPDCSKPVSVPEAEPEYLEDYEEYEEDSYGDDNPYGDDAYSAPAAARRRKRTGSSKKKSKKASGGGISTPVLIVGGICIGALAIGGVLYAVLGGSGGQGDAVVANDPGAGSDPAAASGNSSGSNASGESNAGGTPNSTTANSGNNTGRSNANAGSNNSGSPPSTPPAGSSEMMTTSNSNGQLWVVLSDFKEKPGSSAIGKTYQISYRIAAGRPDPSKKYVIYIGSAMGMVMERYNEVDLNLQGSSSGTVEVPLISQNARAYVAWKKGHQDWEPVSGKISYGGPPSDANRPPTVLEAAGASAQGKTFALANPRFEKGRIGRNALVVDYVLQKPSQGGKFYFLIINGDGGSPVEADMSRNLMRAKQGDTDQFGVSLIGPGSFPSGNLRIHVEMRNSPGRSRMRTETGEIVSNVVTLQR